MNPIGIMRHLIRVAAWLHPHVQAWRQQRTKNRREADMHLKAGNFGEAEKSLRLVLQECQDRNKPTYKTAAVRLELASVLLELNNLDEAETEARQALAAFAQPTTPYLDIQSRIATRRGNHSQAQDLLKQALHREEAPAKANLQLLGRLHQELAQSYMASGDLIAAEKSQTTALERLEQLHGTSHLAAGNARWLLGDIYLKQSKFQLSMVCFESALETYRATEGSDSPLVTRALNSLAQAAMETGDIARATTEYERTLVLMDRQLGTNQEDRAHVLLSLARIYEASGQLAKSQEVVHEAIALLERRKGPELAHALELMGRLYARTGRYTEALPRFERAQSLWMEDSVQYTEQLAANAQQQEKLRHEIADSEAARRSSFDAASA